jgi:hypothetical protein
MILLWSVVSFEYLNFSQVWYFGIGASVKACAVVHLCTGDMIFDLPFLFLLFRGKGGLT